MVPNGGDGSSRHRPHSFKRTEYLLIKMKKEELQRKKITDYLEENYPDYMDKILLADGFEDAFVGVVECMGFQPKACYDAEKCIDILTGRPDHLGVQNEAMTYDEAVEYFHFNVTQAYVGEHTPAFINLQGQPPIPTFEEMKAYQKMKGLYPDGLSGEGWLGDSEMNHWGGRGDIGELSEE